VANREVRLVRAHEEVGAALFRKRPLAQAGNAVVCQQSDGTFVLATDLGMLRQYRRRYDVDTTNHFNTEAVRLPARDDVFEFHGSMDIGWCVTDPIAVVKRNVGDGLALVRSTLLLKMREISRRYPIERCAEADAEVNRVLGTLPVVLPEGITVHRFAVQLTLDAQTRGYLQTKRNSVYESEIEQQRINATRRALDGDNGLLMMHLAHNRGDTGVVIEMINRDRHASEQRRIELFKDLLGSGVIQDIDLDDLTRALVRQSTQLVQGGPGPMPGLGPGTPAVTPAPLPIGPAPGQVVPGQVVSAEPGSEQSPPARTEAEGQVVRWRSVGKGK
jgi:hypothetical protein